MHEPGVRSSQALMRLGLGLAVLVTEYVVLAVVNDGLALTRLPGWWSYMAYATDVAGFLVAGLAGTFVLGGRSLVHDVAAAASALPPVSTRWAIAHVLAFVGFAAACARVFAPPAPRGAMAVALLLAWIATALLLVYALLRALLGATLGPIFRQVRGIVLLGVVFGAVALLAANRSLALWSWLAGRTLGLATALLEPFTDALAVDPSRPAVELDGFGIIIAPGCSGVDGMTLMALFMGGYLFRFRERHRFPNALLLIPVGIAAAWFGNGVRLAGLLAIGAYVSPELAHGGFHSKAGWLFFCAMAVGFAYLCQRFPIFSRETRQQNVTYENPTAAYVMPLLLLLGIGMLTSAFAEGLDRLYGLRIAAAVIALYAYRRYYRGFQWGVSPYAVLIGIAVFGLWLWLSPTPIPGSISTLAAQLTKLNPWGRAGWLGARVFGSAIVVPIAEELAFRGYLQRRLIADDFTEVSLRRFRWWSFGLTSLAFGSLHSSWLAGVIAGAAFAGAVYHRGRMADAIAAHATSNALLCGWAFAFDRWDLL